MTSSINTIIGILELLRLLLFKVTGWDTVFQGLLPGKRWYNWKQLTVWIDEWIQQLLSNWRVQPSSTKKDHQSLRLNRTVTRNDCFLLYLNSLWRYFRRVNELTLQIQLFTLLCSSSCPLISLLIAKSIVPHPPRSYLQHRLYWWTSIRTWMKEDKSSSTIQPGEAQ